MHPDFGDLALMDRLIGECHRRGIRVLLDWVPNHTSDRHPWFLESRSSRDNPKRDRYVWRDPGPDGGPPNNWIATFGGPAWQWDELTGQYYLHSFLVEQPDLNWRNPAVATAMTAADTSLSFTDVTVPIPEGTEVRPITMRQGDVLFFHGSLVHGSGPNRTGDRFRRSLIGHYIEGDAARVAQFYSPALRMDGTPVEFTPSPSGGECGVWVEWKGVPAIEMTGELRYGARRTE